MLRLESVKGDIKEELREYIKITPIPLFYVYFLFQSDILVYIGSTNNLERRLKEHYKEYDRTFYFHAIDKSDARKKEKEAIKKYKPKFNVANLTKNERYKKEKMTEAEIDKMFSDYAIRGY